MEEETGLNNNAGISNLASDQTPPLTSLGTEEPLLKRPLDIVLSALMMILSLPVSLPIAFAIKLEDMGPQITQIARISRAGQGAEECCSRWMDETEVTPVKCVSPLLNTLRCHK